MSRRPASRRNNQRCSSSLTVNRLFDLLGRFGDGTRALSSVTQEAAEQAANAVIEAGGTAAEAGAAARKVVDDSGYEFGDLTRGAVKGFEGAVREATGNEDYQFGDVTKKLAKGLFGALEKAAGEAKKKVDDA